jgi:hypothetical protein
MGQPYFDVFRSSQKASPDLVLAEREAANKRQGGVTSIRPVSCESRVWKSNLQNWKGQATWLPQCCALVYASLAGQINPVTD